MDEMAEMAECPITFGQVELCVAVLCTVGIEEDEAIVPAVGITLCRGRSVGEREELPNIP